MDDLGEKNSQPDRRRMESLATPSEEWLQDFFQHILQANDLLPENEKNIRTAGSPSEPQRAPSTEHGPVPPPCNSASLLRSLAEICREPPDDLWFAQHKQFTERFTLVYNKLTISKYLQCTLQEHGASLLEFLRKCWQCARDGGPGATVFVNDLLFDVADYLNTCSDATLLGLQYGNIRLALYNLPENVDVKVRLSAVLACVVSDAVDRFFGRQSTSEASGEALCMHQLFACLFFPDRRIHCCLYNRYVTVHALKEIAENDRGLPSGDRFKSDAAEICFQKIAREFIEKYTLTESDMWCLHQIFRAIIRDLTPTFLVDRIVESEFYSEALLGQDWQGNVLIGEIINSDVMDFINIYNNGMDVRATLEPFANDTLANLIGGCSENQMAYAGLFTPPVLRVVIGFLARQKIEAMKPADVHALFHDDFLGQWL
jgi:hypothetical protein